MDALTFSVLGPVAALAAHEPLPLGGPRQRAVLGLLLASPNQVVSVDALVDGVWGEEPPPTAERTLHAYVARLRALLEPERAPGTPPQVLVSAGNGYRLMADGRVDSMVFESETALGRRQLSAADFDGAAVTLRAALARWRGPAFADLRRLPRIETAAQRLDDLRTEVTTDAVEAELALGWHESLLPELHDLVSAHPYNERLWASLALAHYRSGNQAESLRTLQRAASVLAEELGIDPGPHLRDLQARILGSDPRLDPPTRPALSLVQDHPGLEGRSAALTHLRRAWTQAARGNGGAVVVAGPAGIGRSRLLRAFITETRAAGGRVLEDPDLDAQGTLSGQPSAATTLVSIDDADLAVPDRWRAWAGLAADIRDRPVLLVLSIREDRLTSEAVAALARLDPDGANTLRLGPLDAAEVARVASAYVGPDAGLRAALEVLETSEGVPGRVHDELERWAANQVDAAIAQTVGRASSDWSEALDGEAQLVVRLLERSKVREAAVSARASARAPSCPYPGLAAYDETTAVYFAGREEVAALLVARLAVTRNVVLLGPSGSGKSSVLRAGLLPLLASGALPGSEGWSIVVLTPGRTSPPEALGRHDLVIVDQAEQLLLLDRRDRLAFLKELDAIRRDRTGRTRMVIGVRSDRYHALVEDPDLSELMEAAQVTLSPMSQEQLLRCVELPVLRAGGRCGEGLSAAIVADLTNESGELPLLSTMMSTLWQQSASGVLTVEGYRSTGGVQSAVAGLAERSYSLLDEEQQVEARNLLLRMAAPGDGVTPVRCAVALDDVRPGSRTQSTLDRLVHDRLVVVDRDQATVAHEALFTRWPRLAAWLAEEGDNQVRRGRLSAWTTAWVQGGRADTDMLRGPRLADAADLARAKPGLLSSDELALVQSSEQVAARTDAERARGIAAIRLANRRLKGLLAAAVVVSVALAGTSAVTLHLRHQADAAALDSEASALAARSLSTGRLDLALLLAAQAVSLKPLAGESTALLDVINRAGQARRVLIGNGQRILQVVSDPGGRHVVILDRTGAATLLRLADGRASTWPASVAALAGRMTQAAAFSADGQTLAIAGSDPDHPSTGLVAFLSASALSPVGQPLRVASPVAGVAYSGDGRRFGTVTDNGDITLRDTFSHKQIGSIIHTRAAHAGGLQVSRDGSMVFIQGTAQAWSADGRAVQIPQGYPGSMNPEGDLVALAHPGQILVVDRASGRVAHRIPVLSTAPLESLAWSPDGRSLAASLDDGSVVVWDAAGGQVLDTLRGHDGRVNSVTFLGTGSGLLSGGFDGRVVEWSLVPGSAVDQHLATVGAAVSSPLPDSYVALAPGTGQVLVGGADGSVDVFDAASGRRVERTAAAHRGGVYDAQVSRDGQLGATAGADGQVRLWDLSAPTSGSPLLSVHPTVQPLSVALSADHRRVAWGDVTGSVTVADTRDGHVLSRRALDPADPTSGHGAITILSFSPDGHRIAATASHVATDVFASDGTGGIRAFHAADDNATGYGFSDDGRHLAAGDSDGSATVWDLVSGRRIALGGTETAATGAVVGAAYGPSGTTVATWGLDGSLRLWDAATGATAGTALSDPASGPIMAAAWTSPGQITVVQGNGQIDRVVVSTPQLIAYACAVAGRSLDPAERRQYLPHGSAPVCRGKR